METFDPQPAPQPVASSDVPASVHDPLEVELHLLRLCLLVLVAGLVLLSVCLNLFLHKQNNLLIAQIDSQTRMFNQNEPMYENTKKRLGLLLQDLQGYTQTHSDIMPILVKYNFAKAQPLPSTLAPLNVMPTPAK